MWKVSPSFSFYLLCFDCVKRKVTMKLQLILCATLAAIGEAGKLLVYIDQAAGETDNLHSAKPQMHARSQTSQRRVLPNILRTIQHRRQRRHCEDCECGRVYKVRPPSRRKLDMPAEFRVFCSSDCAARQRIAYMRYSPEQLAVAIFWRTRTVAIRRARDMMLESCNTRLLFAVARSWQSLDLKRSLFGALERLSR